VGSRLQSFAQVVIVSMCLIFHAIFPSTFGFTSIEAEVTSCYLEQNNGRNKTTAEDLSNCFAHSRHRSRTEELAMGSHSVLFQVKVF